MLLGITRRTALLDLPTYKLKLMRRHRVQATWKVWHPVHRKKAILIGAIRDNGKNAPRSTKLVAPKSSGENGVLAVQGIAYATASGAGAMEDIPAAIGTMPRSF
jgi:hypothetical protein